MQQRIFLVLFAATSFLLSPLGAFAWGEHGHEIIAKLAEERLTPAAKREIMRFLGTTDLASIANWADSVKYTTRANTYNWHFVDIPKSEHKFNVERDCLETNRGYCAIAAIDTLAAELQDRTTPFKEKSEAIKFLVHIVGDISQPFHCTNNNDHGGNEVPVAFLSQKIYYVSDWERPYNLHDVWDVALVDHEGLTVTDYVKKLDAWLKKKNVKKLSKLDDNLTTTLVAWVESAHEIGIQEYVNPGTNIDQTYVDQAEPIVDQQLALAGIRLAALLNRIFH